MKGFALAVASLLLTVPAVGCISLGTHEEPIPPDALSALRATVRELGIHGHVPDVWSKSDDYSMPSVVSITEDLDETEPGVQLVREVECFYDKAWACEAKLKRYLDFRGNRVDIGPEASVAASRETLAAIESLVQAREHRDGDDDFLSESDVQRVRSLVWQEDELVAALADGGPCGVFLVFQRQCVEGACRLDFRGFR